MTESVACLQGIRHDYGGRPALEDIRLNLPAGCMVGLIGPDGVGKSTLLGLVAGARKLQQGELTVLGGDMRSARFRDRVAPRIAYMPQGLGGNLYPSLTVDENIAFFADLFGLTGEARKIQINKLLEATGLEPFRDRPAGKLSGGMKQKLGLCCALIHHPDLLILDEPTTGVDPLSRKRFWHLIDTIRTQRPGMSVLVATAYMEEAERFDWLVAMDAGKVLAAGKPEDLHRQTGTDNLDDAFIALLPGSRREEEAPEATGLTGPADADNGTPAIEAHHLTLRFGQFTAVKDVSFSIRKGEIFGFLGSNGCGKTTTMKMLTGLLTPTEGEAYLFGRKLDARDLTTRRRVGYMSQSFSLYAELTVRQNLALHARLFHMPENDIRARIEQLSGDFGLEDVLDRLAGELPLGVRQRLSLAVAVVHSPELLILDEPTSGVDPAARNHFWALLMRLSREQGVTIFISTHFMNEGERCDRISLMHAGEVLACDSPQALIDQAQGESLEAAFMETLEAVDREPEGQTDGALTGTMNQPGGTARGKGFSMQRLWAYALRESRELLRDPIRLAFAFIGSALLMLILGYGITMDVEDLPFAVLDQDRTPQSRDYIAALSGSGYFVEQPPLASVRELEQRMRSGRLSLAVQIPSGFGRDLKRGRPTEVAVWVDGAMPFRGETMLGYVQGVHFHYLQQLAQRTYGEIPPLSLVNVEERYRYNQDFRSLDAMVPAVIPILLIFIPAILMALGIVREKELGSITNLYVTPVSRLEFLVGKQLPYIAFSMVSYLSLVALAVWVFKVPLTGGFWTLTLGALLYVSATTGLGQVMSAFARTQIAALAATAIITMLPTVQFSGMTEPVSSLGGTAEVIGQLWPASWFLQISRGVFTKGLTLDELKWSLAALAAFIPVLTLISVSLLKKQGR